LNLKALCAKSQDTKASFQASSILRIIELDKDLRVEIKHGEIANEDSDAIGNANVVFSIKE
jgi:hypothetical protein